MIYESSYWKDELLRMAARLESRARPHRFGPASYARIEKDVMMGFYTIRRLIESNKVSGALTSGAIGVCEYAPTGKRVDLMSRLEWWELYDVEKPKRGRMLLRDVCNQVIHSYIFALLWSEDGRAKQILVSSDRERRRCLFGVPYGSLVRLFRRVGRNYPNCMTMRFEAARNDWIVTSRP